MSSGTITSTTNTFGDIPGTLTGSVGVPGPQGPTGSTGATGATGPAGPAGSPGQGVPVGGTSGQFLQKTSGADYATDWVTVNPFITSVSSPLSVNSGVLSIDLSAYQTTASAASTYQTLAGMSSYLTTSAASATYAVIAAGQPTSGTVGQILTKNSGANWDSSWQTLIPGDRYLTTSTTSNTIGNGNKTFTIGTGLSYTPTQNITISYDASKHMHGEVLTYNSGSGVLTVDVNHHTGSGTYASWVVNVGGVTPATSVTWGSITGTLGSQTDLATALNAKLEVTTAASTYAPLASPSLTGTPLSTTAAADTNTTQIATTAYVVGQASSTTPAATGTAAVGTSLRYARADHVHANPLPTGGTTGQVLSKVDGTNYNTTWTTVSGSTFTGGPITSPITYASGNDNSGFGYASFEVTRTAALGAYPIRQSFIDGDKLSVNYTYDDYGATAYRYAWYNYKGFKSTATDSTGTFTFDVGYTTPGNISYTSNSGGSLADFYITPSYITFSSTAYPSSPATFGLGGLTFSDGTTQTTAASGTAPPNYNSLWAYGGWQSASVNTVTDGSGNYYNALTF